MDKSREEDTVIQLSGKELEWASEDGGARPEEWARGARRANSVSKKANNQDSSHPLPSCD